MWTSVFNLSLWVAGSLLLGGLPALSLVGLVATRRWILPRFQILPEDANYASTITQSVMVFYGLAVALIAVSVWEKHSQVEDIVSGEAASIGGLWRDFGGYPPAQRDVLRQALKSYTDQIIDEAWPLQKSGQIPKGGVAKVDAIQQPLFAFEPATEGQKCLHTEALRAYNRFLELRRLRLDAVDTGLPGVLWIIIMIGAVISMISSFFFRVQDARYQAILVALLGVFVAMVIFVIFALDRPFRGDLAISADSYRLIRDQLMAK